MDPKRTHLSHHTRAPNVQLHTNIKCDRPEAAQIDHPTTIATRELRALGGVSGSCRSVVAHISNADRIVQIALNMYRIDYMESSKPLYVPFG